jgi:hypothetical protein
MVIEFFEIYFLKYNFLFFIDRLTKKTILILILFKIVQLFVKIFIYIKKIANTVSF